MHVTWDPALRYRAFFNRPAGKLTVVSSRLVNDAAGHAVGGVLFVTDRHGTLCDMEISATRGRRLDWCLPSRTRRVTAPLTTTIATTVPTVFADDERLVIVLEDSEHGEWFRLGDAPLLLRTFEGELLAIALTELREDPDGLAEARWLDEIERASPSAPSVPVHA